MNIFQLKTKPHGIERCNQFIKENFICVGWPGIGDLTQIKKDEIRIRLQQKYGYSGHKLGNALGHVNAFINTMNEGDIVLILEKDIVHIGKVGKYQYINQYDNDIDGMCHRRSVEWINRKELVSLEGSIQKLMSNRNTICQYPHSLNEDELESIISENTSMGNNVFLGKENAEKFNNLYSEALKILENELNSDDIERRLKAATEILKLKK